MNKYIDCVGEICPIPVVRAQIQFKKLMPGESITVITDHSCTSQGLRDAFYNYNCSITVEEDACIWSITIKKLD